MNKREQAGKSRRRSRGETRGDRNIAWIETYCRAPEGRSVGKPIVLREWQRKIIREIYDSTTRRAIISFGRKNGKGLALDTAIPTPNGWTTIGALRPGDRIYGSDGKATSVEYVSPIHIGLKCWRLTFSDGSSIVADEQHQWLTRHSFRPWANQRKNGSGFGGRWVRGVVTTPEIADSLLRPRKDGSKEHNHKITIAPSLESASIGLFVDPYVFGVWLGDGSSASGVFTCGEQDIEHMDTQLSSGIGGPVKVVRYGNGKAPTIRTPRLGFQRSLRKLGVLGRKHIPQQYLDSGTEQRWALLQGLMDTDGTVTLSSGKTTPRASFSGTNKDVCHGVWKVARSLGLKATIREGKAKLKGRYIGPKWEVSFSAARSEPIFRLHRKQRLLPETIGKRSRTLTIVGCEEVQSVPTVCIKVASDDHLFLAGEGCVPTHNTSLSAFLLLLHLCGPEARANSQLFSAAQSRDQAAILFALAAKMVRMSPDLSAYVSIRDTAKQLYCRELGTLYRALSADASTAYGLSPIFTVHDELGQVRGPRSELYEALETASGAQQEPLSIVISTQAPTDADLLSLLIEDAQRGDCPKTKLFMFSAPENLDPFSDEALHAANPALGDFLNETEVRQQAESARRMPSREAAYRNLVLNQRVNLHNPFVSKTVWEKGSQDIDESLFGSAEVYAGLDLSQRNDLTALILIARDDDGNWHVKSEFFAPSIGIEERSRRDRAPYDLWARDEFLTVTPGASVDYAWVASRISEIASICQLKMLAFDRWKMNFLMAELQKIGVEIPLQPFGQGFKDMGPAVEQLESLLLNGKIIHGGNPVLRWNAANAITVSDPTGARKFEKRKATGRIDGLVALTMAIGIAEARLDDSGDFNSYLANVLVA